MNTADHVTPPPGCAFDKPILHRWFVCARARRTQIAEREIVSCSDERCARRCSTFFTETLARGRFLNRGEVEAATMPYSQIMRFQLGAIRGLRSILADDSNDIDTLVEKSERRFGSFDDLPYSAIIREVAATRMRRRPPGQ